MCRFLWVPKTTGLESVETSIHSVLVHTNTILRIRTFRTTSCNKEFTWRCPWGLRFFPPPFCYLKSSLLLFKLEQNVCSSVSTNLRHKKANTRRVRIWSHAHSRTTGVILRPVVLSRGWSCPPALAMCADNLGCHKWEETKSYPGQVIKSVMVEKFYLRQSESLMNLGIGFASSEEYSCFWEEWMSQQNRSSAKKK